MHVQPLPLTPAANAGPPSGPAHDHRARNGLGGGVTCIAGFYGSASQATEAMRLLSAPPWGLPAVQPTLMAPVGGAFAGLRRGRQGWALRRLSAQGKGFDNRRLMLGLAITAGAVALACGLLLDSGELDLSPLFLTMLLAGVGALAAAAWALLGHPQPRYKRFNHMVRRQLAAGRWVVLLHHLPPQRQDAVFALVREHSQGWCVASAAQPWL